MSALVQYGRADDTVYVSCKSIVKIITGSTANTRRRVKRYMAQYGEEEDHKYTIKRVLCNSNATLKIFTTSVSNDDDDDETKGEHSVSKNDCTVLTDTVGMHLSECDVMSSPSHSNEYDAIEFSVDSIQHFAAFVLASSRLSALQSKEASDMFMLNTFAHVAMSAVPIESSWIDQLTRACMCLDPLVQFKLHTYNIDMYLSGPRIVVEIDENGHAHGYENDDERTAFIRKHLTNHIVRVHAEDDEFTDVINKIFALTISTP